MRETSVFITSVTSVVACKKGSYGIIRTGSTEQAIQNAYDDYSGSVGSRQHCEDENSAASSTSKYCIEWSPYVANEIRNDTANL
jgi:hypothetical protein